MHVSLLDRELMRSYTRLFESRMSGDYGVSSFATTGIAQRSFEVGGRFLAAVKKLLNIA